MRVARAIHRLSALRKISLRKDVSPYAQGLPSILDCKGGKVRSPADLYATRRFSRYYRTRPCYIPFVPVPSRRRVFNECIGVWACVCRCVHTFLRYFLSRHAKGERRRVARALRHTTKRRNKRLESDRADHQNPSIPIKSVRYNTFISTPHHSCLLSRASTARAELTNTTRESARARTPGSPRICVTHDLSVRSFNYLKYVQY